MSSGWIRGVGARTLALTAIATVGLVGTGATAFAGEPVMTVDPVSVGYDEEFTISGTGCFTQVVVGVEGIPGSQGGVTPDQDGTWSTTRSAPSEAGIPPGTLVVFASCIDSFDYDDVDVTLGSDTTSTEPETTTSTSSIASTTAAVGGTTSPRFTG